MEAADAAVLWALETYVLEGKGSCSSPLDAVAPNDRMPITLSPFDFGAFVDPD